MFWNGDTPFFPILWYAGSKRNAIVATTECEVPLVSGD